VVPHVLWCKGFRLNESSRWERYGSTSAGIRQEGKRARRRRPTEGRHSARATANGLAFRSSSASGIWITTGGAAASAVPAADRGRANWGAHLETYPSATVAVAGAHPRAYTSQQRAIPAAVRKFGAPATAPAESSTVDPGCYQGAGPHTGFSV
jgi:hypothetical protein